MQNASLPTKFAIPFANNAQPSYIRNIPTASQQGITAGAASLFDGFPPICFIPTTSNGIPPSGQDINGILNAITAWNRWQAAGGTVGFDSTFASAIAGYPAGSIIQSTTAGKLWLNTVDGNTTNPDSGSAAGWVGLSPSAAQSLFSFKPLVTTARVAGSGSQANVGATVLSGLSYNKKSATSTLVIWGSFQTYTTTTVGAITATLLIGAGSATSGLTNGYTPQGSSQPIQLNNSPIWSIPNLGSGPQAVSMQFSRADASAWTTILNPTGADVSGYPTPNTATLFVSEVEPS